jgi:uncharacterized membrane protein
MFIPGYCLINAMKLEKKLDIIEQVSLTLGTNIIIVSSTALFLSFTPWRITPISLTLTLFILIIILATVALIRESS